MSRMKGILDDRAGWIQRGAVAYDLYAQVDKRSIVLARIERDGSNRWEVTVGDLRASGVSTSVDAAKADAIMKVRSIIHRVDELLGGKL